MKEEYYIVYKEECSYHLLRLLCLVFHVLYLSKQLLYGGLCIGQSLTSILPNVGLASNDRPDVTVEVPAEMNIIMIEMPAEIKGGS